MVRVEPISADRWPDLEDLFGPERGANSGCWCMWPRLPRSEWKATPRDKRKAAFKRLVKKGPPPGLLAYEDDVAIGWCAVGPRRSVGSFDASRVSKPVADDVNRDKTYAITCFYIRSGHRKKGLMETLAHAAAEFARKQGATSVEVCAIDTERKLIWGEGFVGLAGVFRKLKYKEIARRTPTRPLMRLKLD